MKLQQKTLDSINSTLLSTIGLTYSEYEKLDFDEQQELIRKYHESNKKKNKNRKGHLVMFGAGENSIFMEIEKGKKVMINDGIIMEVGLDSKENEKIISDQLSDMFDDKTYTKPVATVKKLLRKITK